MATHEVINQPPPLVAYDVFAADTVLVEAMAREAPDRPTGPLSEVGRVAGSERAQRWGEEANANAPQLRTHDRYGHRLDRVDYHPSYHELMRTAVANGIHAAPWVDAAPGAHTERAAKMLVWYQADSGHTCPISMTYSVVAALRHQPDVAARWEPGLASRTYDPSFAPAETKGGLTCGMAMTEKQGGSDVRANTTRAEPVAGSGAGGDHLLTGHKWFVSAPMSDAFLVLAQAPGGLSCFLVPRWRPDGTVNAIHIQRLKDKLGDRSNASSEVELDGAWGQLVGEEGRGVRTIIEMVNHTRLDCSIGSAAVMRQGTAQAIHHARNRSAFGGILATQPLMANVLADLAVESEAATTAVIWLAGLIDASARGEDDGAALARLATPVLKYWLCKRAPVHAAEAMECLGGSGYVEESGMPRLFRQSPVNGIWEGSGNVICLDVLRAMGRDPDSLAAVLAHLDAARGADTRLDRAVTGLHTALSDRDDLEVRARMLVEQLALAVQASLLVRHAPPAVADAFCATRLADGGGRAFGTLPPDLVAAEIIDRHAPNPD